MRHSFWPVMTVLGLLLAIWYAAAIWLNAYWTYDKATRSGEVVTTTSLIADTWAQKKPKLPAPHQVAVEIWETTVLKKVSSKRSLVYHSWVTLSATLLGFGMGTLLGTLLAVRLQSDHGHVSNALGHREPDYSHFGHRADDYRGPECCGNFRAFA